MKKQLFKNDYRPSFFRRVYLKWKFEWKYLHRDLWTGIKNLVKWFSVVWNDRNWDHTYLLVLIKFKLESMASYHESRKFYVGWENNVKWMRTASRLIDQIIEEKWETEFYDYYDIELYEIENKKDKQKDFVTIKTEVKWEAVDDYLNLYPLQVPVIKEQFKEVKIREVDFNCAEDKWFFGSLLSQHNQKRAMTLLFKILNTHLTAWWD